MDDIELRELEQETARLIPLLEQDLKMLQEKVGMMHVLHKD